MVGDIRNVIVIQSLSKADGNTGEILYNDVIRRRIDYLQPKAIKMTHTFFNVLDKESFVDYLKELAISSELMESGVLIHLEMHGAKDKSGLMFADKSFIDWVELANLFRDINITVNNNLYVTMATCFGRYLYQGNIYTKKAPYSGFISASKEVLESEIIDDFSLLFEVLIASGNLVNAYNDLDERGSNFYYKDVKTVYEENFEAFKKNPKHRAVVLDSAIQTIRETGQDVHNNDLVNLMYDLSLKNAYEKQTKDFLF